MGRAAPSLVLALVAIGLGAPVAFAQDAGAPRAERPADPERKPAAEKPKEATPHIEGGEGEEPDHPPTSAPKPAPPPRQPAVVKDGMVRIPGGRFTMGSDDRKAPANERPARIVVVSPFWIDKTEVTVGAYRECVDKGACPKPARSSAACTYELGDATLPVSCVPWSSAHAFCVAASKRLPREVEWEMAARGSSGGYRYPWSGPSATGCGLTADGTQKSCAKSRPARVATHPGGTSQFGVHDMGGNVEEWVSDWYSETNSDLSPRAGASHVLRGGGWLSHPSQARITTRNWGSAREMGPNVGFRCARDD